MSKYADESTSISIDFMPSPKIIGVFTYLECVVLWDIVCEGGRRWDWERIVQVCCKYLSCSSARVLDLEDVQQMLST